MNMDQAKLWQSVRMRTPRMKRRTLPPGLQEQPWLARDTIARRTSKDNRFAAGFQSLQISRSDLLVETWCGHAQRPATGPYRPQKHSESEIGLRNDGLPAKTTILLVDTRAALKLNDLNLPQPPDRALKEQP
jgi:hypothetical protein